MAPTIMKAWCRRLPASLQFEGSIDEETSFSRDLDDIPQAVSPPQSVIR